MDEIKNQKSVKVLSVVTIISFICCISLIKIAAERPVSPQFCARCHSMEPSFNSWKETVSCNAVCLDCHTHDRSGKTLSVEMEDKSCTTRDCHPREELNSQVSNYANVVSFRHATHIKEYDTNLRLKCTGCHSYTGNDESEGVKASHFSIDATACFICHFTKGNGPPILKTQESMAIDDCLLCHNDVQVETEIYDKVFDHLKYEKRLGVACTNCHFETVQGSGGVESKSCYYCHTKVPKAYAGPARMHEDHVKEHKVPCSPCHNRIVHKWDDTYSRFLSAEGDKERQKEERLESAHGNGSPNPINSFIRQSEEGLFDTVPFRVQSEIYRGVGGRGVKGLPDPMFLATVNCIACHTDNNDLKVVPTVCNSCHERGFEKILQEQKELVSRMVKTLSDLIKESRDQGIPDEQIDTATYNYELIMKDGSYGVHNIKYIKDLIAFSIDHLQENIND
ncbi:MAG: hypothetical protein SCALA701_30300 [Candidatus Scalindua sp.]|nr:hypothetical protein [Planctomycetota bacterium]GJQ60229.1 MAG: hypothetical protein SCALA701_30300 [Candidatus Scalindua sp.]